MNVSRETRGGHAPRSKHLFSESRGTHVIGPLLYIFLLQYSLFHGEAFLTRVVESITEHSIPNLCYDHDFRNNRRLLIGNYCSQGETRPLWAQSCGSGSSPWSSLIFKFLPETKPLGTIHSTKIPTAPTGKRGPPQKVDQFFSKLSRLDRTDPLSFGPKFPEILVEWIAPQIRTIVGLNLILQDFSHKLLNNVYISFSTDLLVLS